MKRLRISIVALLTVMGVVIYGLLPFYVVNSVTNPTIQVQGITASEGKAIKAMYKDINAETMEEVNINFLVSWKLYANNGDSVGQTNLKTYDAIFGLNMVKYKELKQEDKETCMQIALTYINSDNYNISYSSRTKMYNFVAGEDVAISSLVRQLSNDVNADFGNAYTKYFKPFSGAIGTLLGVLALGLFTFLAFTIIFDLAYMIIPFWRNYLDGNAEKGKKPKFTSLEAYKAVQAVENDNDGRKEVISEYMRQKVKQMVAISICLLYLLSGQIYAVMANIIDYFAGILS